MKKEFKVHNFILFNCMHDNRIQKYFSFKRQIQTILADLNDFGLILRVEVENDEINSSLEEPVYQINSANDPNDFFVLPVILDYDINQLPISKTSCNWPAVGNIINNSNNANLQLIFSARDFYLQGFIVRNNNTQNYYYFSDSVIRIIENIQSINLGYSGHYSEIAGSANIPITWSSIYNSFNNLSHFSGNNPMSIQHDLTRVILATSESFRFMIIRDKIQNLSNDKVTEFLNWYDHFKEIVNKWKDWCKNIKLMEIFKEFVIVTLFIVNLNLHKRVKRETNNVFYIKSTLPFINLGKITSIKILGENTKGGNLKAGDIYIGTDNGVYLIHEESQLHKFNDLNFPIKDIILDGNGSAYITNDKCEIYHLNLYGWGSEKVKINNINNERFITIIEKLKNEKNNDVITTIKVLNENIETSDTYIATENRVYFMRNNIIIGKFIIDFIKNINLFPDNSVYGINNKCEIYDLTLNLNDWSAKKISNLESSDLNKELKIYYDNNKSYQTIKHDWYYNYQHNNNEIYHTFNLGKINPYNYKKIEFLGNIDEMKGSRISWGDTPYYSEKKLYNWNGVEIIRKNQKYDYIINKEVINTDEIADTNQFFLQSKKTEWWSAAWLEWSMSIGLAAYIKHNFWYLQFLSRQYGASKGSTSHGTLFTMIGKGIRLYNDDVPTPILNENISKIEIKTSNHIHDELRKKRSIESNENKWTNDLSKDINHEQHLPIDNKPNFSTNNITSL